MTEDKNDTSFRVIDRRLFTEEGELRPEAQEQAKREEATQPAEAPRAAGGSAAAGGPSAGKAPEGAASHAAERPAPGRSPYFDLLVRSLANQAAMLLTGIPDPATGQTVVDIEGAREVIDMLDALREKTRGNLALEEDTILADVLGSLKFSYLEMSKAVATAAAEQAAGKKAASRR